LSFRFLFGRKRTYRLGTTGLESVEGPHKGCVFNFSDFDRVVVWRNHFGWLQCQLRHKKRSILLHSYSIEGVSIEHRTASYVPFVRELILRIVAANPRARFMVGAPWWAGAHPLGSVVVFAVIMPPIVFAIAIADQWPAAKLTGAVALNVVSALGVYLFFRLVGPRPFDPRSMHPDKLPE